MTLVGASERRERAAGAERGSKGPRERRRWGVGAGEEKSGSDTEGQAAGDAPERHLQAESDRFGFEIS